MSGTPNQPLPVPPYFSNEQVQRLEGELETVKQSLTHCELRNHQLLDSLPQMIWVVDAEGEVTYFNRYWYEYTGARQTESLKNHIWHTLHPDDRDAFQACWQEAKAQGTVYQTECRVRGADGTHRWFLVKGAPLLDEQMQVLEWVTICTDIHDRKAAEEARQRSEQKLRLQIQQSPMGVIEWNTNFEATEWNPAAERIFGYHYSEAIGRNAIDFLVPASEYPQVNQAWQDLLHNRGGTHSTNYNLTKSGQMIICEWHNTPLVNHDGQVLGVVSLVQDVTKRQQTAEFALQEQKAFLRNVIDANPNLIFVKDGDGKFTLVNQALAEVFGAPVEEIIGKTDADFNSNAAEVQRYLQDDREVMTTLQSKQINEESVSTNGETRWFQTVKKPLVFPDRPIQVLGVAIDITERKQVEVVLQTRADELARTTALLAKTAANLEKRNQELNQFAYVVSHDLKAPLRAIANLSQWLEEDLDACLNDDTRHQMNLLRGRVHRMEALIDGLLQYSRVGRLDREVETVAVYDLLQDVVDSLAPPPTFTLVIPPDLPVLKTDRLRLEQVFANLLGNAIKHHDRPDGQIEITAVDRDTYYEFAIADDGPGIDPVYHERIFGIFQTLEARDKVESTGIGLSLVKKIVESKGGTIQLMSEVGQGATFRFTWLK